MGTSVPLDPPKMLGLLFLVEIELAEETDMTPDVAVVLASVWLVVVTAFGAAIDSSRNQVSTHGDYSGNTGAVAWFFGCILLWIIVFPWYLIRRANVLRGRS